MYIARCCKEWGLLSKQWNINDFAQKLLEEAVTKFCLLYIYFPDAVVGKRINALIEAIDVGWVILDFQLHHDAIYLL